VLCHSESALGGRRILGFETMEREILRYAQDDKCYAQDDTEKKSG
jgi:hypothetical protein